MSLEPCESFLGVVKFLLLNISTAVETSTEDARHFLLKQSYNLPSLLIFVFSVTLLSTCLSFWVLIILNSLFPKLTISSSVTQIFPIASGWIGWLVVLGLTALRDNISVYIEPSPKGWSGGAMVLGKLPVPGRPTILIIIGQGPIALAVGAGGGGLDIFTLIYPFSSFSLSLGDGPI